MKLDLIGGNGAAYFKPAFLQLLLDLIIFVYVVKKGKNTRRQFCDLFVIGSPFGLHQEQDLFF